MLCCPRSPLGAASRMSPSQCRQGPQAAPQLRSWWHGHSEVNLSRVRPGLPHWPWRWVSCRKNFLLAKLGKHRKPSLSGRLTAHAHTIKAPRNPAARSGLLSDSAFPKLTSPRNTFFKESLVMCRGVMILRCTRFGRGGSESCFCSMWLH